MGSGKTTVGKRLAARLGRHFVDSDAQLRARTHRSADEIATRDGAAALHDAEAAALLDALADEGQAVVAGAGSVVDDASARVRLMADDVTTVWLRARPSTLRERVTGGGHRPFVDDPAAIDRLDTARRAGYEAVADLAVDVDERDPDAVVAAIEDALGERRQH
jgi:shikimate kinase